MIQSQSDGESLKEIVYTIVSPGLSGLMRPSSTLFAGNSGTTMRLVSGLLAGRPFRATLDGDESLRQRPMGRVLQPLASMGAEVIFAKRENYAPFSIAGGKLKGGHFVLPVASAQVETALLLAGLQAQGETVVDLPCPVRDHTRRLFKYMQIPFESGGDLNMSVCCLTAAPPPFSLTVPADISSAAFFMVAAACLPDSHILLRQVGLNPGRTLVLDVLMRMGADIEIVNRGDLSGEPTGDILVRGGRQLHGTTIEGDTIASGIDEIPALALAGAFCEGTFCVRDAAELRVKESDRLAATVNNLHAAGAIVRELADGFEIRGTGGLAGGSSWKSYADHRLAMTGVIASLLCQSPLSIDDTACVAVSYPSFQEDLLSLTTS